MNNFFSASSSCAVMNSHDGAHLTSSGRARNNFCDFFSSPRCNLNRTISTESRVAVCCVWQTTRNTFSRCWALLRGQQQQKAFFCHPKCRQIKSRCHDGRRRRRLDLSTTCTLHDLKIYLRSILMANYVRWWQSFSCSSLMLLLLFCHPINFRVHEWKVVSCKHVSEKRFSFSHFYLQQQNESSRELSWKKLNVFHGLLASIPHFCWQVWLPISSTLLCIKRCSRLTWDAMRLIYAI